MLMKMTKKAKNTIQKLFFEKKVIIIFFEKKVIINFFKKGHYNFFEKKVIINFFKKGHYNFLEKKRSHCARNDEVVIVI
jgi:hypothetical protein